MIHPRSKILVCVRFPNDSFKNPIGILFVRLSGTIYTKIGVRMPFFSSTHTCLTYTYLKKHLKCLKIVKIVIIFNKIQN